MYRLVQFFKRYYAIFLFVLLEAGAVGYYANATSYTRATLLAASVRATGSLQRFFASVGDYFSLRHENRILLERLAAAENGLQAAGITRTTPDSLLADSTAARYFFGTARAVSNSITRQDNHIVIDRGSADGVEENMALLTPEGAIAGYVRRCSEHYAVCMSVLNRDFSIGGRLKGSEYFGSVYWDGTNPHEMTLLDIPRYAKVERGDTILAAYSLRFPPDCFIGTVSDVGESEDGTCHVISIRLGAKMNALSNLLLVRYTDYEELETLAGEYFTDTRREEKR